jgi:hypothetical protein
MKTLTKGNRTITILKSGGGKHRPWSSGAVVHLSAETHRELHKFCFTNGIHFENAVVQILDAWALNRKKERKN